MSFILQAFSAFTALYILCNSKTRMISRSAAAIFFLVCLTMTIVGVVNFSRYPIHEMSTAQWLIFFMLPIGAWSSSITQKIIAIQHGEESLRRKYGPPKVDPALITNQKLLTEYKISKATHFSIFAVTFIYFIYSAANVAT